MAVVAYLVYAAALIVLHPQLIYPFGPDPFANPNFTETVIGPQETPVASAQGEDRLAVLYFMGNGGSLAYFTLPLEMHQRAGRPVVGLAYRGGGGVPGRASESILKADALVAYDWLAARHDGPIAVHGFSLGTGLALHVAARREVVAIALDAPYARLCQLMTQAAWVPACYLPGVQKWNAAGDVAALDAPVLIQHGTADQIITITHGRNLESRMRDAGLHVTFYAIENATHNNLAGQPGYAGRIDAFLAQALNK